MDVSLENGICQCCITDRLRAAVFLYSTLHNTIQSVKDSESTPKIVLPETMHCCLDSCSYFIIPKKDRKYMCTFKKEIQ